MFIYFATLYKQFICLYCNSVYLNIIYYKNEQNHVYYNQEC